MGRKRAMHGWCLAFGLSLGAVLITTLAGNAADLETIRDRGFLLVAVNSDRFPLSFRDAAGNWSGFEVEMAQTLALELLGKRDAVKLIPVANSDRLRVVADGRVDMAIASVTATPSRSRWVEFSAPYYFERSAIVVQNNPSQNNLVRTTTDLRGRSVAVLKNSSAIDALMSEDLGLRLVEVESYAEGWSKLRSGQVQALAGDRVMVLGAMQKDTDLRLLREEFGFYPMAIAMPRDCSIHHCGKK
ncbi:MAG: transporter substrate-binding domain-containing protein [Alkalinema sp. CAN_BIN05]|nr:transporter substrate-binding domain-containing protein [Alkalinema sp. CAN_BIN05]